MIAQCKHQLPAILFVFLISSVQTTSLHAQGSNLDIPHNIFLQNPLSVASHSYTQIQVLEEVSEDGRNQSLPHACSEFPCDRRSSTENQNVPGSLSIGSEEESGESHKAESPESRFVESIDDLQTHQSQHVARPSHIVQHAGAGRKLLANLTSTDLGTTETLAPFSTTSVATGVGNTFVTETSTTAPFDSTPVPSTNADSTIATTDVGATVSDTFADTFVGNTSALAETFATFTTDIGASTTETSETFTETSAPFSTSLLASTATAAPTASTATPAPTATSVTIAVPPIQTSDTAVTSTPAPTIAGTVSAVASSSGAVASSSTTAVVTTPAPTSSDNATETFTSTMAGFSTSSSSTPLLGVATTTSSFSRPMTTSSTTAVPTTSSTAEPTTAEPTTAEPTTAEPTTAEPTTEEPTTAEPTTAEDIVTTPVPTTSSSTPEPPTTTPEPEVTSTVVPTTTPAGGDLTFTLLSLSPFLEDLNDNQLYEQAVATDITDEAGTATTFAFDVMYQSGPTDVFQTAPAISGSGMLSFSLAEDKSGTTTWTVVLQDAADSARTSSPQTLTIVVEPVDDAPTFSIPPRIIFAESMQMVTKEVAVVEPSPPDENQQLVGFSVSAGAKVVGNCRAEGADATADPALFEDVALFLNGSIHAFLPGVVDGEQEFTFQLTEDSGASATETVTLTRMCVPAGEFFDVRAVQPQGVLGELDLSWSWTDALRYSNATAFTVVVERCLGPDGDCSTLRPVNISTFSAARFCSGSERKDCGPVQYKNLLAGTHQITIEAVNPAGTGASTSTSSVVVGRPPTPLASIVHRTLLEYPRGDVTALYLEWTQLAHYGDFLDPSDPEAVSFAGYHVTVIAEGHAKIELSFPAATDTFQGYNVEWSGSSFSIPDLGISGPRGLNISYVVRASNSEFEGDFSERAEELIIGVSSAVQSLAATETNDGMLLAWSIPQDTGMGDSSTEPLTEYFVQASLCPSFDKLDEACGVVEKQVFPNGIDPGQGNPAGPPLTLLLTEDDLQAGVEYSFRVAPRNRLGITPYGSAVVEEFRVLPSLLSPQTLPVYVVEYAGAKHVWSSGAQDANNQIVLGIDGWKATSGASRSLLTFALTYRSSAVLFTPPASGFSQSITGETRELAFTPPDLGLCTPDQGAPCAVTITIWPTDDGSEFRNYITLPVIYAQYPDMRVVSSFPLSGGQEGGAALALTVVEYTGARTREGAGEVSLTAASAASVAVDFTCAGSQTRVMSVAVSGSDIQDALPSGQVAWTIELETPPAPGGNPCTSALDIVVNGAAVPLLSDLSFRFLGPRVDSVTPPAANIARGTGGRELSILLKGIPSDDIAAGVDRVWIEAHDNSNDRFVLDIGSVMPPFPESLDELVITAQTPELPIPLAGVYDLTVSVGSLNLTIEWQFLTPPRPVIVSSSVEIMQDGLLHTTPWIDPSGGIVSIKATIRGVDPQLGWSYDALSFYLGGDLALLDATCQPEVVVGSQVSVDCNFAPAATALMAGSSGPLSFDIVQGTGADAMTVLAASTTTDQGGPYTIFVVDPNSPARVAWSAQEGPDDGGTIVVVGLMGVQPGLLSTIDSNGDLQTSVGLDFNLSTTASSTAAMTYGILSLDQFDAEGDLFEKIFLETRVATNIVRASTNQVNRYRKVVRSLRNAPGAGENAANPAILVAMTPDVSDLPGITEATVTMTVNDVDELHVGNFHFRPQPTGVAAIAEVTSPTGVLVGGASGGDRLLVRLLNFPIVAKASDLVVQFGAMMVDVLEMRESNSEHTIISIEVPSVTRFGQVDVQIWSSEIPSTIATFQYTFVNDIQPSIVTFNPFSVYNDGGYDLEVVLSAFPGFVVSSDVEIIMTPEGSTSGVTISTADITLTRDDDGLTTIEYPSSAEPAHIGPMTVKITAGGKTATYSLSYVAPPALPFGDGRSLTVSSGFCDGMSTYVTAKIPNVRRVTDPLSVLVSVGDANAIDRLTDPSMRVVSSMTSTSVSFTMPTQPAGSTVPITIDLKYVGAGGVQTDAVFDGLSFECLDPNAPGVDYVFPPYGTIDEPTTVEIGIQNYPLVNSTTLDVTLGAGATLQSVDVVRSDKALTIAKLSFTATVVGPLLVTVSPSFDSSLLLSTSVEIYGSEPRVINFSPLQEYEYGQTTMTVEAINVPAGVTAATVQFGADFNVSVSAVEYRTPAPGATRTSAKFSLVLPTSDGPMEYDPLLHISGVTPALAFPSKFMFTPAPSEKLERFEPEWASIEEETTVRIYLTGFPGAPMASQIAVLFLWPDGVAIPAAPLALMQVDSSLEVTKVQSFELDVVTPVNQNVKEGNVRVFVWNTMYSSAVASAAGFRFIDPANPRVIRAESEFDVGFDEVRVPMSVDSEVTVTIENAPSDVDTGDFVAFLGPRGDSVEILFASTKTEGGNPTLPCTHDNDGSCLPLLACGPAGCPAGIADANKDISCAGGLCYCTAGTSYGGACSEAGATTAFVDMAIPPSALPQFLYGFVAFGDSPGCTPTCCETYTCASECSAPVGCFAVEQYDDSQPVVSFNSDLRGPATGGTSINALIQNFPALPADQPAVAFFGDPDNADTPQATIVPIFSHEGETQLIIVSPAIDLEGMAQKSVEVTLVHPLRTDQVITFWFTYFAVQPFVSSCTPDSGSTDGGTVVTCEIQNFQYPSSNVIVELEDSQTTTARRNSLPTTVTQCPSNLTRILPGSSELTSFVQFVTPSTSPGLKKAIITPVPCAEPCQFVEYLFNQVDLSYPEIVQPRPVRGSTARSIFPLVSIDKLPVVSAADATVTFVHANSSIAPVQSPAILSVLQLGSSGVQVFQFEQPPGLTPGMYTVQIMVQDPASSSSWALDLHYRMFDPSLSSIVDISPETVPTSPRIKNKHVPLRTPVSIFVVQLPRLRPADLQVTVDGEVAQVVEVNSDANVDFARIDILAPALRSPGPKAVGVTILGGVAETLETVLDYGPMYCQLQRFCRERRLVADLRALSAFPTRTCSEELCTDTADLKDMEIVSVSPGEGPLTGDTEVQIEFRNLPAETVDDVTVTTGRKARKQIAEVVSLQFNEGSTLLRNSGTLTIRTPPGRKADETRFKVRVNFEGIEVRSRFWFDYLPVVEGEAVISELSPRVLYTSGELELVAELLNIGKLRKKRGSFDTADVQFKITDQDGNEMSGAVDQITDSSKVRTIVGVSRPGPWPLGNLTVKLWAAEFGEGSADTELIPVVADPGPMIVSSYPVSGKLGQEQTVVFKVMHLPVNISEDDITGMLKKGVNASDISIEGIEALHEADCQLRVCSFFDLFVSLPAVEGAAGDASIDLVADFENAQYNFSTTFTFISASVELFQPRIQALDEAGSSAISVYLSDFPTRGCGATASCVAALGSNSVHVAFGARGDGTIVDGTMLDVHGFLFFQVRAPRSSVSGTVNVGIGLFDSDDNLLSPVGSAVTYTYQNLPPEIAPVDASTAGGTLISLTVYGWGSDVLSATSPDQLSIYFNTGDDGDLSTATEGDVLAIDVSGTTYSDNPPQSSMAVVARTPAMTTVGRMPCALTLSLDGGISTVQSGQFMFEFYTAPSALAAPSKATPGGATTASDGISTIITVSDFPSTPAVLTAADVQVVFAAAPSTTASVTAIERAGDDVVLTVTVPPSDGMYVGSSAVTITYLAPAAVPLGMSPTDSFERETKVAVAEFSYEIPSVAVEALYCEVCDASPCIVNGRCSSDSSLPLENRAPVGGTGTITFIISDTPEVPTNLSAPVVKYIKRGAAGQTMPIFSPSTKVVYSDEAITTLEAPMPPIADPQAVDGEISIAYLIFGPRTVVPFRFTFFSEAVVLNCPRCEGAQMDGAPFMASISNFPLSQEEPVLDQLFITFGRDMKPAKAAALVSTNETLTILEITPPSYSCPSCTFEDGAFTVPLAISLKQSGVGAETHFTFWAAPRIEEVRFDATGTSIYVTFDQDTNLGGMTASERDCSLLVDAASLSALGTTPASFCQWVSERYLRIALGPQATIVPNDMLTINAARLLRSENMLSQPSIPTAVVRLPESPVKPTIKTVGQNSVDLCSDVIIEAQTLSVREVVTFWGCNDCDHLPALQSFLSSYQGDTLVIPAGSSVLAEGEYQIVVSAVDFMGIGSEPFTFELEVRGTPTPQAIFSPHATSVFVDEEIQIKALMGFSNCPIDKATVAFAWTQVGGQSNDALATYLATASAQAYLDTASLYIPANTLVAGETYQVQVEVTMSGDATKTGSAVHTITINKLGLEAVIAGGSAITVTSEQAVRLDASGSRDLNLAPTDAQGLSFAWACSKVGQPCLGVDGESIAPFLAALPVERAVLVIPGGTLPPSGDEPYLFSVTVSKDQQVAAYTMHVVLTVPPPPGVAAPPSVLVAVAEGSGRSLPSVQRDGSARINSLDELVLTATCSAGAGTFAWSFEPPVDFGAAPTGAVPFGTTSSTFQITADAGLLATGTDYTATVVCSSGGQTGSNSVMLRVNNPPSSGEGPCEVCAQGQRGCSKTGSPTTGRKPTTFKMKCGRWSDTENDNPLEFRFGVITDGVDLGWTEWKNERNYKKKVPAGVTTFKAQVRDSKGAVTEIMYDEVVADLIYDKRRGRGSDSDSNSESDNDDRRRLLQASLSPAWQNLLAATDGLTEQLQLRSDSGVLDEVRTLTRNIANNDPPLTADERSEITRRLYDAIDDIVQTSVLNADYVATALQTAQAITTTEGQLQYLSPPTAVLASKIVKDLAASNLVSALTSAAAQDAYDVTAVALGALQHNISCVGDQTGNPSEDVFARSVMGNYEAAIDDVASKYAASLQSGQGAQDFVSFASTHRVMKEPLSTQLLAVQVIPVEGVVTTTAAEIVDFVLPADLASGLGVAATTDVSFDFGVYGHAPVVDQKIPISPIVSISLFDGSSELTAANPLTTPVKITIPLDTSSLCETDRERFTGYGQCMYWDTASQSYSADGCRTEQFIGKDRVTCYCNHLTSFIVVPDFDYTPPPTTSTTTPPPPPPPPTTAAPPPPPPPSTTPEALDLQVPIMTVDGEAPSTDPYFGWVGVTLTPSAGARVVYTTDNTVPTCLPVTDQRGAVDEVVNVLLKANATVFAISCSDNNQEFSDARSFRFVVLPAPYVQLDLVLQHPGEEALDTAEKNAFRQNLGRRLGIPDWALARVAFVSERNLERRALDLVSRRDRRDHLVAREHTYTVQAKSMARAETIAEQARNANLQPTADATDGWENVVITSKTVTIVDPNAPVVPPPDDDDGGLSDSVRGLIIGLSIGGFLLCLTGIIGLYFMGRGMTASRKAPEPVFLDVAAKQPEPIAGGQGQMFATSNDPLDVERRLLGGRPVAQERDIDLYGSTAVGDSYVLHSQHPNVQDLRAPPIAPVQGIVGLVIPPPAEARPTVTSTPFNLPLERTAPDSPGARSQVLLADYPASLYQSLAASHFELGDPSFPSNDAAVVPRVLAHSPPRFAPDPAFDRVASGSGDPLPAVDSSLVYLDPSLPAPTAMGGVMAPELPEFGHPDPYASYASAAFAPQDPYASAAFAPRDLSLVASQPVAPTVAPAYASQPALPAAMALPPASLYASGALGPLYASQPAVPPTVDPLYLSQPLPGTLAPAYASQPAALQVPPAPSATPSLYASQENLPGMGLGGYEPRGISELPPLIQLPSSPPPPLSDAGAGVFDMQAVPALHPAELVPAGGAYVAPWQRDAGLPDSLREARYVPPWEREAAAEGISLSTAPDSARRVFDH